ncbi:MAG: threo-3-hydroxy-L-aspartate ammonia-lyase [Rhodothermaceae bacterium]|nr:threo-3-hydroxy-L-aspartate ammonia-lyase [Rhodothermaceae bacterium]MYC04356.1 threo-3-hydroxy-L-aspartate ammonia-lyase [Rhodothermaceae bacterium]MYI17643.1 threo-3-hydroxy-L-aspartate ammonia-lyase [Rhodothermaceae bacterium]
MTGPCSVGFEDVCSAAEQLQGVVHKTPVLTSRTVDARVGARIYFKCENFQRSGSFKFRGAYNTLRQLPATTKEVLTFSSGNHAQAVALAGAHLDIQPTIVMPRDAPSVKRAATVGYGAKIIPYDRDEISRETLAEQLATEQRLPIIPPYDHPHIVAGQGTAALELLQDYPDLDVLLVPCGGGGLLSGSLLAAHAIRPTIQVIGVEPDTANDAALSLKSGVLHTVHNPETIADGARTPSLGILTFEIIRNLAHDIVTVSDAAILSAMQLLWERMKIVVEPTGALGMAALLSKAADVDGMNVGVILSGGNVGLNQLQSYLGTT